MKNLKKNETKEVRNTHFITRGNDLSEEKVRLAINIIDDNHNWNRHMYAYSFEGGYYYKICRITNDSIEHLKLYGFELTTHGWNTTSNDFCICSSYDNIFFSNDDDEVRVNKNVDISDSILVKNIHTYDGVDRFRIGG